MSSSRSRFHSVTVSHQPPLMCGRFLPFLVFHDLDNTEEYCSGTCGTSLRLGLPDASVSMTVGLGVRGTNAQRGSALLTTAHGAHDKGTVRRPLKPSCTNGERLVLKESVKLLETLVFLMPLLTTSCRAQQSRLHLDHGMSHVSNKTGEN